MIVLAPIWAPMAWIKSRKRQEQPNWAERFGRYTLPPGVPKSKRRTFEIVFDPNQNAPTGDLGGDYPSVSIGIVDSILMQCTESGASSFRLQSGPHEVEVAALVAGAWRTVGMMPHDVATSVRQRFRMLSGMDLLARTPTTGRLAGKIGTVAFAFSGQDEPTPNGFRMEFRSELPSSTDDLATKTPATSPSHRIWYHVVSVGEAVASMPILRELRRAFPAHEIVLSVTTSSGHQTAREKLVGLFDHLVYFPFDLPWIQLRAMRRVQPELVVVMETELWMDFLWAAKNVGAKTMLVNGRISNRSYPRAMKFRPIYACVLSYLDRALMQSEVDRRRILDLGARDATVIGNCKFDQAVEGLDADPAAWRYDLGLDASRPTIVVGSTRGEFEERLVAEAIAAVGPERVNLVYAPRHLERAPEVAAEFAKIGVKFAFRSRGEQGSAVLLDTYGELGKVYSVADVVIVGGGFDKLGGQNILQPLAHGKPVLFGPHMTNFRDTSAMALEAQAAIECSDAQELAEAVRRLLDDEALRRRMGAAAGALIATNVGASRRYVQEAIGLISSNS